MTLNMQFVNDTGLPDDQVFVTFQDPGQTLAASFGANNTAIARANAGDMMTKSYSLATLGKAGLEITNAEGPVVFISYAATKDHGGFVMDADLSGNEQPSFIGSGGVNYKKAYQPFEITAKKGEDSGQGNLTNINYFAAPISIRSFNGGTKGTQLQERGYYGNTAKGTAKLADALNKLTSGAPTATVTENGKALRYIGPSSYGAGDNPFSSFAAYLNALHKDGTTAKIQNHNAFNTKAKDPKDSVNYNYELNFVASFAKDNTITLSGDITTTIIKYGHKPTPGTTYKGAVLTISPTTGPNTSEDIFTNTIYGQADPHGAGKGSTTFNAVWDTLEADMNALGFDIAHPFATTQSLAIGEITTGLLGGFVGSKTIYKNGTGEYKQYDGSAYGTLPSAAWWNTDPIPEPKALQSGHTFYSDYSDTIFAATDNQVYSIPFSDRFGKGPLMQTQLYNGKTVDTWVVTLGVPTFMLP
ncbi:hypothetical protein [Planktotalea sp.]|uniref:hypothetical protein n=1 Tax=Planktotalea sp. TaxID=2029877 RepID=UPI0032991251